MYHDIAGDGALGNFDDCAGGAAEGDGSEGVADSGVGDPAGRAEMGSFDLDLAAGHGSRREDAVQMRCAGVRRIGLKERSKRCHGPGL